MIWVTIICTRACGIVWWMQTKYDRKIWLKGVLRWDFAPWSSISCSWYGCYTFFAWTLYLSSSHFNSTSSSFLFMLLLFAHRMHASVPWWLEGSVIDLCKRHRRQYASESFFLQNIQSPPALPPEKNEGPRHYSFLKYLGLEHFILTEILKPLPFPFKRKT